MPYECTCKCLVGHKSYKKTDCALGSFFFFVVSSFELQFEIMVSQNY